MQLNMSEYGQIISFYECEAQRDHVAILISDHLSQGGGVRF